MKGPLLFVVSLVGAIGVWTAVVAPARGQTAEYRERLTEAPLPRSREAVRAERAADDLARVLNLVRGTGEPVKARIEALLAKLGVEKSRPNGETGVEFEIDGDQIAGLLDIVQYRSAPVLASLRAEVLEGGDRYRVTLLFAPVPSGFTTP